MTPGGGLAWRGCLDARCGTGRVVLLAEGDRGRLAISNVATALKLRRMRPVLNRLAGGGGCTVRDLPPTDIEVAGWRVARLSRGSVSPTLPVFRGRI
ncbi:MAG: hypothetical protein AAGF47_05905 [Planctomycetota bacterium]